MNGDDGMMMPPSGSWPPPNAIVHHAATPVQISAISGGLNVYLIGTLTAPQRPPPCSLRSALSPKCIPAATP